MVASISGDVYNKAKLGLARIYFYENNLLKAKTITKEVLESCTDNVKFFAKTLLMSIEMKE
jgi:Tfp pilus assembly protein FimV